MSNFAPTNQHLREALLFCFNLKKSAAESYRLLAEAYGEQALSETTCRDWFRRFKNNDFDLKDKQRPGQPKKFQDEELEALLDEDSCQTLEELAGALNVDESTVSKRLKAMGMIQKEGNWLPHELTERDIAKRLTICELLLDRQRRKSFLHRIITGDEKWVYYENPKRKKSWVKPGEPSTSTPKRNIHGSKVMLCIWWDQKGVVYYELLKSGETVNADRYRQQLINLKRALQEKRSEYAKRHDKVIFQHDNARPHIAKPVKETLEALRWDVLPHPPYSPDIAPSDYHLFRSMQHGLSGQHFKTYEEIKKWLDEWIASKQEEFFYRGIHLLPERWAKVVANDGQYFE
jgi:histone-lysine N-methyltransferase SETMAR